MRKALAERVGVLPQVAGFEDVLTQTFQRKHAASAAMSGKELRTHTQMSGSRSVLVDAISLGAHQQVIATFSSFSVWLDITQRTPEAVCSVRRSGDTRTRSTLSLVAILARLLTCSHTNNVSLLLGRVPGNRNTENLLVPVFREGRIELKARRDIVLALRVPHNEDCLVPEGHIRRLDQIHGTLSTSPEFASLAGKAEI